MAMSLEREFMYLIPGFLLLLYFVVPNNSPVL